MGFSSVVPSTNSNINIAGQFKIKADNFHLSFSVTVVLVYRLFVAWEGGLPAWKFARVLCRVTKTSRVLLVNFSCVLILSVAVS